MAKIIEIMDGNQAAAYISYAFTEVAAILHLHHQFRPILRTLVIVCLFQYSHPSGYKVVFCCALHLHFPNIFSHLYVSFLMFKCMKK